MIVKINHLNLRYIRVREDDRQKTFMIDIVMIRQIIKIGIDQRVVIGEYHSVGKYNVDRIIEISIGIINL